jgi:kumamolisin
VSPNTTLSLVLELRDPAAAKEASDIAAIYTPGSKTYGHYLTAAEVAARYGPSPGEIAKLRSLLTALGLTPDWTAGNAWMTIEGPASRVEKIFGVTARWYRSPRGVKYYAAAQTPVLPGSLRPYVTAVGRLNSDFEPSNDAVPQGGLAPADLLASYDITPLRNAGIDGTGETVVFFESDGFAQADLDAFTNKYNLPPLQPVVKAGPTFPSPGGETEMDLEVVHEIAPGAKLLIYNFDSAAAAKSAKSDADYLNAELQLQTQMINESKGDILSQSWGICEKPFGAALANAFASIYTQADAMGESSFVSSGDNAAYECLRLAARETAPSPDYLAVPLPADAPGVTAVGGTRLSVTTGSPAGWYDETVWEEPAETNGTGGGVSEYFPRPSWQVGPGVSDPTLNPQNMRSIPDVSADADPASGVAIYAPAGNTSGPTVGGGTSQSAPIWAGIAALIDEYLQQKGLQPVGFMNPALYQIAAHPNPLTAFHDITAGSNLYYPATPGYDMASGLGTPDAWNLAQDLAVYERGGGQ